MKKLENNRPKKNKKEFWAQKKSLIPKIVYEKIRKINRNWVFEIKKLIWIAEGITEKTDFKSKKISKSKKVKIFWAKKSLIP